MKYMSRDKTWDVEVLVQLLFISKIGLKGIPDRSTSSSSLFSSFCDQECAAWEDNGSWSYLCFFFLANFLDSTLWLLEMKY